MHRNPPIFCATCTNALRFGGGGEDLVEEGFLLFKRATDNFLFSFEAKAYKKTAVRKFQKVVPNILTAGFIVMSAFGRL